MHRVLHRIGFGFPHISLLLAWLGAGLVLRAEVPRPEHQRPDAFRPNWATLNGEWQFEIDEKGDGEARGLVSGKDLAGKIQVPFCPESKLSGVGHYGLMKHTWFRRSFELPAAMTGKRVRLHFGAIDYQAWVWVNGQAVGSHIGGDVAFAFDISRFLKPGANELVVHAFDDTPSGNQPTGKQTHTVSEGCVYTRTTGIWQPVWLEAVGAAFIESFSIIPDPDNSCAQIEAVINGDAAGLHLSATANVGSRWVGTNSAEVQAGQAHLTLKLLEKHLWEPGQPFLYDLHLALYGAKEAPVDEVASYFGLRKVTLEGRAILINGKRVFQRLILDQGFYPDGVWTAPADAELKADIERSMAAGYNGARLHQKVFEPRFLYWADKLGYLVWGEFPNWGFNYRPANYANLTNEWSEIVRRDRNHPAIIGWCPFNETGGEAGELQRIVWNQTKAIDPTRPVIESSGYAHTLPKPEVLDAHDYDQTPQSFKQRWLDFFGRNADALQIPARYGITRARDLGRPFMVSEFGGTGWGDKQSGWGYGAGPQNLEEFYTRYAGLVGALLDNPDMFGFCYTQLTDVEQEHNGLYYYDRRPKFDLQRLHAITARPAAFETAGPAAATPAQPKERHWEVLVGAAADGDLRQPYHYTTAAPAADWITESFNDADWKLASAPFGNALPGVRTPWTTGDIWLRRAFDLKDTSLSAAALVIFHDEDTEIYVNGKKIWSRAGYITSYQAFPITAELKTALKPGRNTLAVHTHQTTGGQFIDLALLREP